MSDGVVSAGIGTLTMCPTPAESAHRPISTRMVSADAAISVGTCARGDTPSAPTYRPGRRLGRATRSVGSASGNARPRRSALARQARVASRPGVESAATLHRERAGQRTRPPEAKSVPTSRGQRLPLAPVLVTPRRSTASPASSTSRWWPHRRAGAHSVSGSGSSQLITATAPARCAPCSATPAMSPWVR